MSFESIAASFPRIFAAFLGALFFGVGAWLLSVVGVSVASVLVAAPFLSGAILPALILSADS